MRSAGGGQGGRFAGRAGVARHALHDEYRHDQLGHRHGEPQRPGRGERGQRIDQRAADDKPSGDRHDKRRARLHQGLEIVGGEDVKRQQQERDAIAAHDGGRGGSTLSVGDMNTRTNPLGTASTTQSEDAEKRHSIQRIAQRLPDTPPCPRAEVARRMGCAACPTLYAQHWTKVLILTIMP